MPRPTITPAALLKQLNWRYATQKFDPDQKIPADIWETLEQALILTPSSFGLQPWKFFIIQDAAIRDQLKTVSWDQGQITDASHMIVFTQKRNLSAADIDHYTDRIADVRHLPLSELDGFKQAMLGLIKNPREGFDVNEWMAWQVYIAIGNFLTAAAILGVDTCPMEGLDVDKYDGILNLEEQGFHTCAVVTAGYRAKDDPYAALAKVRFPANEVITHL